LESSLGIKTADPHYRGILYLYITLATALVFALFGIVLAIRLERERRVKDQVSERQKDLTLLKDRADREKEMLQQNMLKVSSAVVDLSNSTDENQVLYVLVRTMKMNLDFDRVNLMVRDGEAMRIKFSRGVKDKGAGLESVELPCSEQAGAFGIVCRECISCIFAKDDYIPPEYRLEHPYSGIEAFRSRAFIIVPIRIPGEDRPYGVLAVDKKYTDRDVSENDLMLTEILADMAGSAIDRIRMRRELEKLASIDDLTDIYNRRMWMEHANHALRVAKRYEDPLSLIMVDIDDFKVVNDTWGHQKGDRVLQVLAAVLKEQSRGSDVVGRYGGEEFVVLCPRSELEGSCKVAERLRKAIESTSFGVPKKITATFGVAQAAREDIDALDLDALLFKADKALYAGKEREGKNCVVTWDEIASEIVLAAPFEEPAGDSPSVAEV
jgi:diguanylate cyclase (GGDEF)-like protein